MSNKICMQSECLYNPILGYYENNDMPNAMKTSFITSHSDLIKICKKEMLRRAEFSNRKYFQFVLTEKEIYDLNIILSCFMSKKFTLFVHSNGPQILESFKIKNEKEAMLFFENKLKNKTFNDCFGNAVTIPGVSNRFMYKDDEATEFDKHIQNSDFYKECRGKRQSLIEKTIQNSKIIFERSHSKKNVDRMYLINVKEIENNNMYYFAVIVFVDKKSHKAEFNTAFSINDKDAIFRRLVLYKLKTAPM